jgi:hypothetical protein
MAAYSLSGLDSFRILYTLLTIPGEARLGIGISSWYDLRI